MNGTDTITVTRQPDGTVVQALDDGTTRPYEGRTDWARVDALTEEEVEANALSDPDNPPLSAAELDRMRPVPNPKQIRQRLRLTQTQFAARFQVPLGTLRDWEQGVREPDRAAKTLLRVIDHDPEAVVRALKR